MKSYIKINSKDLDMIKKLLLENKIEYEEYTSNFYKNVCTEEAKVQLDNYLSNSKLKNKNITKDLVDKIIKQVSDNIYDEYDLFDEISERTKYELENVLNTFGILKCDNI